jgi:hypothetical protein
VADDGKWYPPHLHPNAPPLPPPPTNYGASRMCPACGGQVFATAAICVRCGTPLASPHSKGAAILLAVFLHFWAWLYTYKRDAWKFWVGLILEIIGLVTAIFLIGFVFIFGVWIWAIIDVSVKSESWYQLYPNDPSTAR